MEAPHYFLQLKQHFPEEIWPQMLLALRQDQRIWERLSDPRFVQRVVETLPYGSEKWTPAALCLLEFDDALTIPDLTVEPMQPLPASLRDQSINVYRKWLRNDDGEKSLKQAGLLALALYEHRRIKGSWVDLGKAVNLSRQLSPTVIACLYGMVSDPDEMLRVFLNTDDLQVRADLAIHVVLCNKLQTQAQLEQIALIVEEVPADQRIVLLQALERQRPWLAAEMTRIVIERGLVAADIEAIEPGVPCPNSTRDYRWFAWQLDNLGKRIRVAELERLAAHHTQAAMVLAGVVKELRYLQGRLAAQFARVVDRAQASDQTDAPFDLRRAELEAWRQAVQLAPNIPEYTQGLTQALLDAGRYEESLSILDDCHDSSPAVAWLEAQIASEQGDSLRAGQAAWHALELIEAGAAFDEEGFLSLAHFFIAEDLPDQAVRTARLGLKFYPLNQTLLSLLSKLQLDSHLPEQALVNLSLAQAVNHLSNQETRSEHLQRLLIESLEGIDAWGPAFEERQRLLENQPDPNRDDLYGLALAAQRAGSDAFALQMCQRILSVHPDDGLAYGLSAEAALALGNTELAVDHFRQAVHYMPARGDWWLTLARIHQQRDQSEQALSMLRSAAQAAPDHAGVHLALGEIYLDQALPTQALGPLRRTASLAPSAYGDLRLGQALYQLGHLEEAAEALQRAYQSITEPAQDADEIAYPTQLSAEDCQELVRVYAQVLLALGNDIAALPLLEAVIKAEPELPEPRLEFARALLRAEKDSQSYQRAIAALQPLLDDGAEIPTDLTIALAEAQALLAEAHASAGEYNESMAVYDKVMKTRLVQQPGWQTRLSLGLGRVALKLEQPDLAVEMLQAAVQQEPHNPDLQRALFDACIAAGNPEKAFLAAQNLREMFFDDLDTLNWFVDQALLLSDMPGGEILPARQSAVDTLRTASRMAPQRGDISLRLAELLQADQDVEGALQVYENLVRELQVDGVSPTDYRRAAENATEWGASDLGVALYYKAIGLARTSEDQENRALAADLYTQLANVHANQGDNQAALAAFEQGIQLDPTRKSLHMAKADLLLNLQAYNEAQQPLEEVLRQDPQDARAHYRLARVKRILDDLPAAFHHAVQAVNGMEPAQEERFAYPARLQAAQLAYLALRPLQAHAYLWEDPLAEPSTTISADERAEARYDHAILQAELALNEADLETAASAIELVSQLKPEYPRSLSAAARLANLNSDRERAENLFQAAQHALDAWSSPWEGLQPDVDWEYAGCVNGQCLAALDLKEWTQAYELSCRRGRNTKEPLAQFLQAKALVLQAEEQSLCDALDVSRHAPGVSALSEESVLAFEKAIQESDRQVQAIGILEESEDVDLWGDEAVQMLRIWRARGQAVFDPSLKNAGILQAALRMSSPTPEDVSALLMAFLRAGEPARAVQAARAEWPSLLDHPRVMVFLALALTGVDPDQALNLANRALTLALKKMCINCIQLPMLQYLVSRLAFQVGNFQLAEEAILAALADWPDESRWHAMVASIYLAQNEPQLSKDSSIIGSKALPHLQQAAKLEPQELEYQLQLGRAYMQVGDFVGARKAFEQASLLDPECLEPWLALARIQRENGELVQAAASADRAIEVQPNAVEPLILRAEIALLLNNPRSALSRAQAALRLENDQPRALFVLAQALDELDRPVEALEALEKAMPGFDASFSMQVQRLDLVRRARGVDIAMPQLRDMVEHYPQEPGLVAMLAEWLAQRGDVEEAILVARSVLSADPEKLPAGRLADMHYLVGRQMRSKGQLDQAVFHLSKATNGLSNNQPNLDAFLELGRAHQDRREFRQALDAYQAAIDTDGDDYRPYYFAGQVLKDMKEYLQSERMLRRAAFLAPDEVSVHRLLGAVVALNLVHNRNLAAMDG